MVRLGPRREFLQFPTKFRLGFFRPISNQFNFKIEAAGLYVLLLNPFEIKSFLQGAIFCFFGFPETLPQLHPVGINVFRVFGV